MLTLTVVAMESVHHDYRPTFLHFCNVLRCLMMTLHLIVYRAFFTKLCMSKVQYVCGEHMTSYKRVTSFGPKAAILFSGYDSINCVFATDYKERNTAHSTAESAY